MTEDTKATLNNMKNSITATGKKVFSPNHLKKGAGLLIVLAIIGAGGKYFVHQNKVEAKTRAVAARTTLLQNMAAQNNISLVSTDDVKNKVADALGKEVGQINFKNVNLVSPTLGKDGEKEDRYKHKDKRTASLPVPPAPPVEKQAPLFYSVKCRMDQVDYKFVVNAQNGKILRSEVEPAKLAFLNK